mmetsp:Transcript_37316/g.94103  ORF Transcript_37316/g.94103 Transcript_37316/m.94103 type:complete len:219 (-) Transcript_37316:183-839(-)
MAKGTPLTDTDRWPWLLALAEAAQARVRSGRRVVVACSALKASYRDVLRTASLPGDTLGAGHSSQSSHGQAQSPQTSVHDAGCGHGLQASTLQQPGETAARPRVQFVLLDPPKHVLEQRLLSRAAAGGHFMPPTLLDSQLATLERGEQSASTIQAVNEEGDVPPGSSMGLGSPSQQAAAKDGACSDFLMVFDGSGCDGYPETEVIVDSIAAAVKQNTS